MALNFRNAFGQPVFLALVYGNKGCGPEPFRKQGWWQIQPGEVKNIWNVALYDVNRYGSFYAESGNVKWSGSLWYLVTNAKFNQCFNDDANCNRKVPFLQLDFKNADNGNHNFESMEITFGPGPGQLRKIGSVRFD